MEQTKAPLRDQLMAELHRRLGKAGTLTGSMKSARFQLLNGGACEAAGIVEYSLPDGTTVSHKSDILFHLGDGSKIAVELKFLSSVTDQFKARSFDAEHIKKQHASNVRCVLAYVRFRSGISIKTAKSYSYCFDDFIGVEIAKADEVLKAVEKVTAAIEIIVHLPQSRAAAPTP